MKGRKVLNMLILFSKMGHMGPPYTSSHLEIRFGRKKQEELEQGENVKVTAILLCTGCPKVFGSAIYELIRPHP